SRMGRRCRLLHARTDRVSAVGAAAAGISRWRRTGARQTNGPPRARAARARADCGETWCHTPADRAGLAAEAVADDGADTGHVACAAPRRERRRCSDRTEPRGIRSADLSAEPVQRAAEPFLEPDRRRVPEQL